MVLHHVWRLLFRRKRVDDSANGVCHHAPAEARRTAEPGRDRTAVPRYWCALAGLHRLLCLHPFRAILHHLERVCSRRNLLVRAARERFLVELWDADYLRPLLPAFPGAVAHRCQAVLATYDPARRLGMADALLRHRL